MAHFAQIEDGIVRQVIVVNNDVITDANGIEQESIGSQFCTDLFGGIWKQTSYNGSFRGKYAGIGDIYDEANDVFTSPSL